MTPDLDPEATSLDASEAPHSTERGNNSTCLREFFCEQEDGGEAGCTMSEVRNFLQSTLLAAQGYIHSLKLLFPGLP